LAPGWQSKLIENRTKTQEIHEYFCVLNNFGRQPNDGRRTEQPVKRWLLLILIGDKKEKKVAGASRGRRGWRGCWSATNTMGGARQATMVVVVDLFVIPAVGSGGSGRRSVASCLVFHASEQKARVGWLVAFSVGTKAVIGGDKKKKLEFITSDRS
jgi:hypothetical protein